MGLMGTLAKIAVGYAAARGIDRFTAAQDGRGLMGGGAQIKGKNPASAMQAQMAQTMSGGGAAGANPMAAMMDRMKQAGIDLSSMMGGAAASGPMAAMADQLRKAGIDVSAMTAGAAPQGSAPEPGSGLLSSVPSGGAGMAGMLAAASGAAAMQGKGMGQILDQLDTGQAAPEAEKAAALMLRAMIQAAKSDGEIDETEKARILETVGADADPADIAFVKEQLAAPLDPEALARDTPEAQKMQVYSGSLMTIRVDTDDEAEYLDRLARAMQLDETAVNMLHMQMGLQPLYN